MSKPFDDFAICAVESCNRLPVRTVWEFDGSVIDVVMLCRLHATTYQPEGRVLHDAMLPTAELDTEILDAQITP